MRLIFLGLPGVGKGTQAKNVAANLKIPHISTGDIFRDPKFKETEVGRKALEYSNNGKLVPDEIVVQVVGQRLKEADCRKGYLFDGFPRTLPQAQELDKYLKASGDDIDAVVYLKADPDVVLKRLTSRRSCPVCKKIYNLLYSPPAKQDFCDECANVKLLQRDDDKPETVKNRLAGDKTPELAEYYTKQNKLRTVDGTASIEKVRDSIEQVIASLK